MINITSVSLNTINPVFQLSNDTPVILSSRKPYKKMRLFTPYIFLHFDLPQLC